MMSTLSRRTQQGLTVIESMVVVAVVGILAALAVPSFNGMMAAQRVKGINAEVVTDMQFARSEAARRNRDVHILFRTSDNCYTVFAGLLDCNCSLTPGVNVCPVGSEEIKTVKIPLSTGVAVSASSAAGQKIDFKRPSDPSGGGVTSDFSVTVASNLRGQLRTTVHAAGRPTVCTPDGSFSSEPPC